MPTIKINKKVFEKLVGKKLPLEKLKDRISYLGPDLEDVNENEIVVEIFPNRPDMLSEGCFERTFSSVIGVKTGLKKYNVKKSGHKVIVDKSVSMRPYTTCAIVKNLNFNDDMIREIMQIQEKLALTHGRNRKKSAYGLYPLNNINFPIHYTAKNPNEVKFRPLGLEKEISAVKVEELHPKGREFKWVAEGWKKYPFFIDGKENIMCMLPYTNSHHTGKVDETTKEVFIECTGTDLENVKQALNIIVTMLADMGGQIYSLDIIYPSKTITTPNLNPEEMKVDIGYVNKILGLDLKENQIKTLLERMGFDYKNKKALIPAYRTDILHQIDLIEDIAIAYGYENFIPSIPNLSTISAEDKFEIFKNKIADLLSGMGLIETCSYHLSNKEQQCSMMNTNLSLIELENSISSDYNILKAWNIPSLMEILSSNKHHEYPQKIFTIGTIFKKNPKSETNIEEDERLAIAIASEKTDYTEIRQILDYLFRSINVKYEITETEHDSFITGRVGRVIVNGKNVAYIGEISPQVITNWELEMPVTALELNLTELFNTISK
jgi:phenylalanyl-tRNA synthetase beta chain